MGAGDREDLGLLSVALQPAPISAVWKLAAELRPHRARLLSGGIHGPGHRKIGPRAAAILFYAHRLCACHDAARNPAAEAGPPAQSVSVGTTALSSFDQPVD